MADPVDRRAVLHIIGNAFDDSAAFTSADYVRIRRQVEALPSAQPNLDEWCRDCKEYDQERHSCPRWNRVIRQTVEDLKAGQPEPQWIPCKERMPKNRDTVLVCLEFGILGLGHYAVYDNGPSWCFDDGNLRGDDMDAVKAWMPLPNPYRQEGGTV